VVSEIMKKLISALAMSSLDVNSVGFYIACHGDFPSLLMEEDLRCPSMLSVTNGYLCHNLAWIFHCVKTKIDT
jgi:hypothetical protein